jgi:hypothetical protein
VAIPSVLSTKVVGPVPGNKGAHFGTMWLNSDPTYP